MSNVGDGAPDVPLSKRVVYPITKCKKKTTTHRRKVAPLFADFTDINEIGADKCFDITKKRSTAFAMLLLLFCAYKSRLSPIGASPKPYSGLCPKNPAGASPCTRPASRRWTRAFAALFWVQNQIRTSEAFKAFYSSSAPCF